MRTEPNDPVFHNVISPSAGKIIQPALTKREHFASLAMQGLLASTNVSQINIEILANSSVGIADALIVELNK